MNTNDINNGYENREERRAEERRDARELLAKGKNQSRNNSAKINRIWLWLGVIILIFILFYWLFSIGLFEDMIGYING